MRPTLKQRALQALRSEVISEESGKLFQRRTQLEWFPIGCGTVTGEIGPIKVKDDGKGHLRDTQHGRAVADINYATGTLELEPWFAMFACASFTLSYRYEDRHSSPFKPYELRLLSQILG